MKNMTKKIMALAMIVGFVNISAEIIKFAPNEFSKQNCTWDTKTNVVKTPSNPITYFDIKKIDGYEDNLEIPQGYKLIGTYKPSVSDASGIYVYRLYGKNYTR